MKKKNNIKVEKTYGEWLELVNQNGLELKNVPKIFKDYHLCSEAVDDNCEAIKFVPKKIMDYRLAYDSVIYDGIMLRYIPDKLKDLKMCNNAIYDTINAFKYVPGKIKTKEFCLKLFDRRKNDFLYIPEKYLEDEDFLIKAIERNMLVFKNIPKKYLNTNIIKTALKLNGSYLKHVPKQMINKEMILIALNENRSSIDFVPNRLINDELFEDLLIYRTRLKSKKQEYMNLSKKEKWDTIISIYPEFTRFIPYEFRCKEIYINILKDESKFTRTDEIFGQIPKEFIDREITEIAINSKCISVKYIQEYLNKEDVKKIIKYKDPSEFKYIPEELLDKDLCFEFLKNYAYYYDCIPKKILNELKDDFIIHESSNRTFFAIKFEDETYRFSVGCQNCINKEKFIDRIHHDDYGEYIEDALSKHPYRQEYLDILEQY